MTQLRELADLVFKMRIKQKQYFKRPITGRLLAAKEAEVEVDRYLDKLAGIQEFNFVEPMPADEIPY